MKYRFYRANRRRSPLFAILGSRTTPFAGARLRSSYILHVSVALISLHSNLSNLSTYTHTFYFQNNKLDFQIRSPECS